MLSILCANVVAVSIGWNTYAQLDESCVQYGLSSGSLHQRVCASVESTTYPTSRTYENVVVLTDLTPGLTYYYKIVSTNSTVDHFLSPRTPGDRTPFSFNAVIDLGVYGEDGFTINGDRSKRDTIPTVDPALNHTTIANRKPYMVSPGNHEAACQEIPFTTGLCPDYTYATIRVLDENYLQVEFVDAVSGVWTVRCCIRVEYSLYSLYSLYRVYSKISRPQCRHSPITGNPGQSDDSRG